MIYAISLYQVCALIVLFSVCCFITAYFIGRFLWEERKANKSRDLIRQDQVRQSRYKYAVYPGYVISQNDGDRHYIGADQLIRLYGVDRRDCLIIREHERGMFVGGLIALTPQSNGDYSL